MFATAPVLVLKRTVIIRVVLCLFLLPLCLLTLWGAYEALEEPGGSVAAAITGIFGVGLGFLFWYFFSREANRRTTLYEDGIAQTLGSRTTELRWSEVTEVWFQAIRIQAGGLIGAAVSAAMEASARKKGLPLDARGTNITVRLVGRSGEKAVLTSNDKPLMEAFDIVRAKVNPRLVEEVTRRVQHGETVTFGKVSISLRGIGKAGKEPVAFHEIASLAVEKGRLVLKKKGSWLSALAMPIQKIPNLFVLTEVYTAFTAGPVDRSALQMGRNLASRTYV